MSDIRKQCGNCRWLNVKEDGQSPDFLCEWEPTPIPFWAHITNGDHRDWVKKTDGRNCPTFSPRVDP